jgi:hypothetical protein
MRFTQAAGYGLSAVAYLSNNVISPRRKSPGRGHVLDANERAKSFIALRKK